MKERKETISIVEANIWGLALLVLAAVIGLGYYWLIAKNFDFNSNYFNAMSSNNPGEIVWWKLVLKLLAPFLAIIFGAVVHELVHGITWAHYCKNGWRSISFGVMWKLITPYCHCSEPLRVNQYRTGALMPLFVVGILPLLVSPFVRSIGLCIFGIFFIAGAVGDIMVVWHLRKEKKSNTILDHPTEPGYLVYEEE